ncbi:MAG: SPOR domain-containing protein [Actinobacteria bacterium]|nr:SPOR domain-containing protein [Actinomycetota bacterium]
MTRHRVFTTTVRSVLLGVVVTGLVGCSSSGKNLGVSVRTLPAVATTASTSTSTTAPATTTPPVPQTAPQTNPPVTPPATNAAPPSPPDGVPMNSWVVMLGAANTQAQAQQRVSDVSNVAPDASIVNSSSIASLNPGWWVIYTGSFSSGQDAINACLSMGFTTRHDCYAAYFSENTSDRGTRMYPDGN